MEIYPYSLPRKHYEQRKAVRMAMRQGMFKAFREKEKWGSSVSKEEILEFFKEWPRKLKH